MAFQGCFALVAFMHIMLLLTIIPRELRLHWSSPLYINHHQIELARVNNHRHNDTNFSIVYISRHLSSKIKISKTQCLLYLALLLANISNDIEPNPGPYTPKYPCQICGKAAKNGQLALSCTKCSKWYHVECMQMCSANYHAAAANKSTTWLCCDCGMPNFSSTLFNSSFSSMSTSNSFAELSNISTSSETSNTSIGDPIRTSSPRRAPIGNKKKCKPDIRSVIINFQCIKNKKAELLEFIDESDPDIIFGSETWLDPSINSAEFFPDGQYDVYRRDRPNDKHGGVLLAVRRELLSVAINLTHNTEIIAAKLTYDKTPIVVSACYRNPRATDAEMSELCGALNTLSNIDKKATVWIGGDFNLPDIDWSTNTVTGNQYSAKTNKDFLDSLDLNNLDQVIKFPTRGENTLDLFLTNRPTLINSTEPKPGLGKSDHDIVFINCCAKAKIPKPSPRKIWLWKKADHPAMSDDMKTFETNFIENNTKETPIEDLWTSFRSTVTKSISKNVPNKMTSSRISQPWCTREVKKLSQRKKRAYNKARRTKKTKDWDRYKHLMKLQSRTCKKAYHDYIDKIVSPDLTTKPKRFWGWVKSQRNDSSGVAPLKGKDGLLHTNPVERCNLLNEQFCSVFSREDTSNLPQGNQDTVVEDMPDIQVGTEGVLKLLRKLNPHKACGPDGIPAQFLKSHAEDIATSLTLIFQASLHQGKVPSDWKKADIFPIHKKADKSNAANYRPISLTSICCKLCEHIVHSSVMKHLDRLGLLHDAQHGFRKRRSTETQLIQTIHDIATNMDVGDQTDVILLDFSKAFDKVPHKRLLLKLHQLGIRGNTLNWIESFLKDRTQRVVLENSTSESAPVLSGVPQGTVLGPLLFLVYINDLPQCVNSQVKLFADDCAVFRKIRSLDDQELLQKDLQNLQEWEAKWLMEFHPQKCQLLQVTKRKALNTSYTMKGHKLTNAPTARYLGVDIDSKLTWAAHISRTAGRAKGTIGFLRRNLQQCPKPTREACYKTLARPQIEYAAAIWDPQTAKGKHQVEMVQRKAARFICNDHRWTSSVTKMIDSLKLETLEERRQKAKATMMYRITNELVDIETPKIFSAPVRHTRGHCQRMFIPFCKTDGLKQTFFHSTARIWNKLPDSLVDAKDLAAFQQGLAGVRIN